MKNFTHPTRLGMALALTPLVFSFAPQPAQAQDEYRRGLERARAVAVPESQRPRRFVVADFLVGTRGSATMQQLDDGLQTMALLGMNTLEIKYFDNLTNQVAQRARSYGITRYRHAIYAPLAPPPDKAPALYFSWNRDPLAPANVEAWAREQARQISARGYSPNEVALFHMSDEPGWYFPYIIQQFSSDATRLEHFRAFLRSKGLQPRDVGANSWSEVMPIPASQARDLPSRRLFFWTARYPAETSSDAFKIWSDALRRQLGPQALITTNWNNWVSRFYLPAPDKKVGKNPEVSPNSAMGMMDWMDVGRKQAVNTLWTEDWFTDEDAQNWSYYADAMHSAARAGQSGAQSTSGARPEFGGYVVGRKLGDHPSGARYKALSLIGHGAKVIEWYAYGPEARFPGNGWSENAAAYGQIAGANRLIGRAEDLLFPGRRADARIAIVLPRSAQVWDESPILPLYQQEVKGLHFALTHLQYPVDFVDEEDIANGTLAQRGYFMVYVTTPNLAATAQVALRDWIQQGGTAIFSPGAAAADEYNTPVSTLDAARGVRAQIQPRRTINDDTKLTTRVTFRAPQFGSDTSVSLATQPLQTTTARVIAEFSGGGAAVASNRLGRGLVVSYGFWPGSAYLASARRSKGRLPSGWDRNLRLIVAGAPRVTRIGRTVELSNEVVEAARLDSSQGIAVTLLNWTDAPIGEISVKIRNAGAVRSVGSAEQGALQFSRDGDDIRVNLPLRDVDVLMIRR